MEDSGKDIVFTCISWRKCGKYFRNVCLSAQNKALVFCIGYAGNFTGAGFDNNDIPDETTGGYSLIRRISPIAKPA